MNKNVSVAMYIRLSNEDADISKNDAKIESNSVSNQRDLLMDFISRHPDLADSNILEFCDDGYSGTNFERPAVQQLLTKVRQVLNLFSSAYNNTSGLDNFFMKCPFSIF